MTAFKQVALQLCCAAKGHKKAERPQRWPRDGPYAPTPPLVSPKFPMFPWE